MDMNNNIVFIKQNLIKAFHLLRYPFAAFTAIAEKEEREHEAVKYTAVIFALSTIISYITNLIIPYSGLMRVMSGGVQPAYLDLLLWHIVFYSFFVVLSYVFVGIWYVLLYPVCRAQGLSLNYARAYQAVMYSMTPIYVLGNFGYAKILGALWFVVLLVMAIKILLKTSYGKAIISLILPLAIVLMLMFVFAQDVSLSLAL